MKPYLFAPIVIAGLITAAGTAKIASAELSLLNTGREVVAMLNSEKNEDAIAIAESRWDRDSFGDLASTWKADTPSISDEAARFAGIPAPETSVEMTPACERKQSECEKMVAECEKLKAERDRSRTIIRKVRSAPRSPQAAPALPKAPEAPQVMLASNYSYQLASAKGPSVTMVAGPDKHAKVFEMTGKPSEFRMMFDSKKFAEKHKMFAMDIQKLDSKSFKNLSKEDLQKLRDLGVHVQLKGGATPATITINPMEAAGAAAQISMEALTDIDNDNDCDKDIETSSK